MTSPSGASKLATSTLKEVGARKVDQLAATNTETKRTAMMTSQVRARMMLLRESTPDCVATARAKAISVIESTCPRNSAQIPRPPARIVLAPAGLAHRGVDLDTRGVIPRWMIENGWVCIGGASRAHPVAFKRRGIHQRA